MKSLGSMAGDPLATVGDSYLPGSGNRGYRVSHYALDLDYRMSSNRLSGTAMISAVASERLEHFSLDLTGLTAAKIRVNGIKAARFTQTDHKLTVTPAWPLEPGAAFEVRVKYSGAPSARPSPWGEVGWEELTEGVLVAGQPSGAPTWFPCNDHPSNKATLHLEITTDSPYRVISTGQLVSTTIKSSRTRWVFETREPLATYLATVQIGYYKPHPLPARHVRQIAYIPYDLDTETAADFAGQPAMMQLFEELFGPYPFQDYSVVVTDDDLEIPLEAHGLSVFGRNHIDGEHGSNRLIAHELAHSWFGNSLTLSAWKDIWLHEGFACYAEWLWSEASGGPSAHRLAEQNWAMVNILPQDFELGDPGPVLMFDDRVYKRGALTLHALRLTVGDAPFFTMLRSWTAAHRHGSVNTEEFLLHASTHSSLPVVTLLRSWLFERALPRLPRGFR